jgi:hypothetical protein
MFGPLPSPYSTCTEHIDAKRDSSTRYTPLSRGSAVIVAVQYLFVFLDKVEILLWAREEMFCILNI